MREIKVDSRRNAIFVIASGACTAWQSTSKNADSRKAYFASAKFMDRHADKSARDDRESNNSKPTTQAAVFSSDFWGFLKKHRLAPSGVPCFQAVGAGIYLGDNEQAHRAESTKSAEKTTRGERSINA